MTVESPYSLLTLAKAGGFTGTAAITAALIAEAESQGVPTVVSKPNSDGSVDQGLWQINSKAHPNYDSKLLLSDPVYNAKAAYAIYHDAGNSFTPWTTFKTGAYKDQSTKDISVNNYTLTTEPVGHGAPAISSWRYLGKVFGTASGAQESDPNPTQDPTYSASNLESKLVPGWLNTIGGALTNQSFWIKVGIVLVAAIALITGLVIWVGSNKSVQHIAETAAVA